MDFAPNGKTLPTCVFAFAISFLNNFYQAYSSFYTITAADSLQTFINISYTVRAHQMTENDLVWIWSVNLNALVIGNILGTLVAPWFCERLGRKMTLLCTNCALLVATGATMCSFRWLLPELFLTSRILGSAFASVNFGALALFIMVGATRVMVHIFLLEMNYTRKPQEFSATQSRGMALFICGLCFNIVTNIGMLSGMDALLGRNLELLIGVGLVPSCLAIAFSICLKETPKFLLLNRKDKEGALVSLRFYQGNAIDAEKVLDAMQKERQLNDDRPLVELLREMFAQRHLRMAILLGWCALQLTVGTCPVTTTLLAKHFALAEAQLYSILSAAIGVLANIVGTIVCPRVSCRKMLLYTGVMNSACIVLYAMFDLLAAVESAFKFGCLAANTLYFVSFGFSLSTIPFYLCGELLPQNFRSLGQSLVFLCSLCTSFPFTMLTLPAYAAIGVYSFLALFTVPQVICLLILWIHLPETRGREIHEIVDELKQRRGA